MLSPVRGEAAGSTGRGQAELTPVTALCKGQCRWPGQRPAAPAPRPVGAEAGGWLPTRERRQAPGLSHVTEFWPLEGKGYKTHTRNTCMWPCTLCPARLLDAAGQATLQGGSEAAAGHWSEQGTLPP